MKRFSENIERMKTRHVLGTVFCLTACVLYTPLAFAAGTDLAREDIQRAVGTLLEQIGGMDVGDIELGAGNDFTITRSDGSQYVFENVAQDASGVASATVSVYDSDGMLTESATVDALTAVDANRVDFEAEIMPAAGGVGTAVIGSLTGLRSTMYTAVGSINENRESRAVTVDYSGVNDSGNMTAPSVVLTSMDGDGVGSILRDDNTNKALALLILIILLILAFLCMNGQLPGCHPEVR